MQSATGEREMGIQRNYTWFDVADLDAHLTVFLSLDAALEGFLSYPAPSLQRLYKIRTDSGTAERTSRAQISDCVDSLGGSLKGLEVWYPGPGGRECLDVQSFAAFPVHKIGCTLYVFGDNENETAGRFDTLRNRMDAEVKRQWPKPKTANAQVANPTIAPPPASMSNASASVSVSNASSMKHKLDVVSRHPIVVGVAVAGLLAIGSVLKAYFG